MGREKKRKIRRNKIWRKCGNLKQEYFGHMCIPQGKSLWGLPIRATTAYYEVARHSALYPGQLEFHSTRWPFMSGWTKKCDIARSK
jgi:hypothetical protein